MNKSQLTRCCRRQSTLRWLHFNMLFLFLLVSFQSFGQTVAYNWKNSPIGGGGFVTGIVTHKTSGDRYCRTDVGGAYRWDAANNKWIQLMDWLNESELGFIGVEALALDPQNANNIYMLCGTDYINNGRTAILKSTDKGNTFTYTDVTDKFKAHGNGGGRSNGERLAVDPKNSNILYCGTRSKGLWKSTDAGVTWNLAWNGVTTTANGNGICFVLFDPSSSVVNGVSQTIYVGVSRTDGANLYMSTNGGASFTDISPTTSFMPHRAALQGTTMYVTYANGEGPNLGEGSGKLFKRNTSTGAWANVTPSHSKDYPYGGVSIDPTNVNRVIVSTCGMYWNNQFGTGWGDFVFITTDGGSTWTLKNGSNATYDANGMEWSRGGAINWMDCIEFDQASLNRVRVIGGGGVFTCPDITATNTSWKYDVVGIEETALLDGISIPGGPFISSFGDISGFVHEPLTSAPSNKLSPVGGFNNNSIAYAAANPNKVVRVANEGNVVYYSNDKGATWTAASTNVGAAGRVSISADGGTILHCPWGSSTTSYSTNNGGSWSSCSGVSVGDAAPVADQVNSNIFYIYHPSTGEFFRSTNKGVSFSAVTAPGASTANHPWESVLARTVPGLEGHIWIPLGRNGLKYSTNGGSSYTTVANVSYCKTIGIGKTMSGASYPTVFIWGTVSGVTGLFRSTNQGGTWARMNNDATEFGGAPLLVGDMNVDGRVFMSAGGGRGLIYWDPTACTPTAITSYMQVGGTWTQTSSATVASGATVILGPQPTSGGSWSWSGMASGTSREVTLNPTSSGTATATYTNASGCQSTQVFTITISGGSSFVTIANRATGLLMDGMGRTSAGSTCGQYASSGSWNQMWTLETSGAYVYIKNRNTGLYIDGRGVSTNGSYAGQWTSSTSDNLQWQQETVGSYVKFKNKATGLYLDGLGNTTNGADLSQWANSGSNNQQWAVTTVASGARLSSAEAQHEESLTVYPNPATGFATITLPAEMKAASITVINASGNILIQEKASGTTHALNMTHLPAGLYLIKASEGMKSRTLKLLKQ